MARPSLPRSGFPSRITATSTPVPIEHSALCEGIEAEQILDILVRQDGNADEDQADGWEGRFTILPST